MWLAVRKILLFCDDYRESHGRVEDTAYFRPSLSRERNRFGASRNLRLTVKFHAACHGKHMMRYLVIVLKYNGVSSMFGNLPRGEDFSFLLNVMLFCLNYV